MKSPFLLARTVLGLRHIGRTGQTIPEDTEANYKRHKHITYTYTCVHMQTITATLVTKAKSLTNVHYIFSKGENFLQNLSNQVDLKKF